MKRLIMEDHNRENTSLRDYVELWAGRWRQTDLWTLTNTINDYTQSQKSEPKLVSLCCMEHNIAQANMGNFYLGFLKVEHCMAQCECVLALARPCAWHPVGLCHLKEKSVLCLAILGHRICIGEPVFRWMRVSCGSFL